MKTYRPRMSVVTLALLTTALLATKAHAQVADVVYENGSIYTVNEKKPYAQAVAIKDGKFIKVGSNDDVEPLIGKNTRVIDLCGRTGMPGLIDTHVHIFGGSFTGNKGRGEPAFRQELARDVPGRLRGFIRHGVTTVKSTGDPLSLILELRRKLKNGDLEGPRLLVVGPAAV